ncbi:hypothetical protein [Zavarzinella formosa]|uniref:hypothetical protein n=1 Tax=Zavarzinella formosa TaxID=360055 RepID=UPI0002E94FC9|nr:hypothetical protein [Zavarzinella formosa]
MDKLAARRQEAVMQMDAYSFEPDFIEQQYQVPPVIDLLAEEGVRGVSRLIQLSSFGSERLHTFVYSSDSVVVTTVRGATSLWRSIPQYAHINDSPDLTELKSEPFVASRAERRFTTLSLSMSELPPLFASWDAFEAAANEAPSCATETLDGASYRHRVRAQGVAIDANWQNPDRRQHASQAQLLAAYSRLLELADLFPEEREATERKRLRNREKKLVDKRRKEERKRGR